MNIDKLRTLQNGLASNFYSGRKVILELEYLGFDWELKSGLKGGSPFGEPEMCLRVWHTKDTALEASGTWFLRGDLANDEDFLNSFHPKLQLPYILDQLLDQAEAYTEAYEQEETAAPALDPEFARVVGFKQFFGQ